ncbi:MAG: 16S rRNA (guanine(527)-N(7))-methyltransferase RsmG [Acidobacteriota bacterium]
MPTLPTDRIADLLAPYLPIPTSELLDQLSTYLDLLLRWNARTNLTAIRSPEEIVRRHFGESLFAAAHLPENLETLLDFGSGAGFPGLPIQLLRPELKVTLAESQHKKSSFLREAVRTLNLPTEVLAARVETLPPSSRFDSVTLRAVDNMQAALEAARPRIAPGGWLILLTTTTESPSTPTQSFPLPVSTHGLLTLTQIPS